MTMEIAIFIVDTLSCMAFIATAYYAFAANRASAKMGKHSTEKDKKIMQFYQQSINEKIREKRIDDMVAYTQSMLGKWSRKTPALKVIARRFADKTTELQVNDFDFENQKIAEDDIYFDGVNLTFWRCVLDVSTDNDAELKDNPEFIEKLRDTIEKNRVKNVTFDAIIRLLLSDFDDLAGISGQKLQFYQCFRASGTIYQCSQILNRIIYSLYTNKMVRNNLFAILKHRIPQTRNEYDENLKNILGISLLTQRQD